MKTNDIKKSAQFELINLHAAGIDIGSRFHYVCVGVDKDPPDFRTFHL